MSDSDLNNSTYTTSTVDWIIILIILILIVVLLALVGYSLFYSYTNKTKSVSQVENIDY